VQLKPLFMVLSLSFLVLVGIQVISPLSVGFKIDATVDINPDTFNVERNGKWITAYITLPEDYNVSDIDVETILLQRMFEVKLSDIEDNKLMVKFDGSMVANYLLDRLNHMGLNRAHIDLTITGQLIDGMDFEGTDTIVVINPPFAEQGL